MNFEKRVSKGISLNKLLKYHERAYINDQSLDALDAFLSNVSYHLL